MDVDFLFAQFVLDLFCDIHDRDFYNVGGVSVLRVKWKTTDKMPLRDGRMERKENL
jgi:hypothetical protein